MWMRWIATLVVAASPLCFAAVPGSRQDPWCLAYITSAPTPSYSYNLDGTILYVQTFAPVEFVCRPYDPPPITTMCMICVLTEGSVYPLGGGGWSAPPIKSSFGPVACREKKYSPISTESVFKTLGLPPLTYWTIKISISPYNPDDDGCSDDPDDYWSSTTISGTTP